MVSARTFLSRSDQSDRGFTGHTGSIMAVKPPHPERPSGVPTLVHGARSPMDERDNQFVKNYRVALERLSAEETHLFFRNVILSGGSCGFANGGRLEFLVNTDPYHRYRVTVRISWRQGINEGS